MKILKLFLFKIINKINIWNYNILQQNLTKNSHNKTLIVIRKDILYSELDAFTEEMQAIYLHTHHGVITIATAHQPPRRPYLLKADCLRLFQ